MTALDMLVIVFMVMSAVSVLGLIFLYLLKNETLKKVIFYFLALEGMALAWMNALSTPQTFIGEWVIGWILGIVSVAALLLQISGKWEKKFEIARLLVTVSVVLGMINVFIY